LQLHCLHSLCSLDVSLLPWMNTMGHVRFAPLQHPYKLQMFSPCTHIFLSHYYQSPAMGQGFSSLRSLTRSSTWILEPEASTFAESSSWSNKDMDPVPPHKRTWTMFNYVTFWISCAVSVTTWQLGSSMLAVGLSWYRLFCVTVCHSPSLIDCL
jgi:hypothetical protein